MFLSVHLITAAKNPAFSRDCINLKISEVLPLFENPYNPITMGRLEDSFMINYFISRKSF